MMNLKMLLFPPRCTTCNKKMGKNWLIVPKHERKCSDCMLAEIKALAPNMIPANTKLPTLIGD